MLAATLIGVFFVAQAAVADGRFGQFAFEGAGNCPADAPCILEVVTEGILPYNQPIINGTAEVYAPEVRITVDETLVATAVVREGWFEHQFPWHLAEGEHIVYVQSRQPDGSLSPISNVVRFTVAKPANEPQISATRVTGATTTTSTNETTPTLPEATQRENASAAARNGRWEGNVWYAFVVAAVAALVIAYRRR